MTQIIIEEKYVGDVENLLRKLNDIFFKASSSGGSGGATVIEDIVLKDPHGNTLKRCAKNGNIEIYIDDGKDWII